MVDIHMKRKTSWLDVGPQHFQMNNNSIYLLCEDGRTTFLPVSFLMVVSPFLQSILNPSSCFCKCSSIYTTISLPSASHSTLKLLVQILSKGETGHCGGLEVTVDMLREVQDVLSLLGSSVKLTPRLDLDKVESRPINSRTDTVKIEIEVENMKVDGVCDLIEQVNMKKTIVDNNTFKGVNSSPPACPSSKNATGGKSIFRKSIGGGKSAARKSTRCGKFANSKSTSGFGKSDARRISIQNDKDLGGCSPLKPQNVSVGQDSEPGGNQTESTSFNFQSKPFHVQNNSTRMLAQNAPEGQLPNRYNTKYVDYVQEHDEEGNLISNDFVDSVVVECKLCQIHTPMTSLKYHTKNEHKITINEYKAQFGDTLVPVETVYHKCGLCGELVLLDSDHIAGHLRRARHITLKEYNDGFMVDTRPKK